jgi:PAS domain S-box-containing protein
MMKNDTAEFLTHMLDYIHDMIILIRMDNGRVEYLNQTSIDNFGYTLEEMNEVGINNIRRPIEKNDTFFEHLDQLKNNKTIIEYAYAIRKNGTKLPVEANATHINKNGVDYNLVVLRDITERLKLTEELKNQAMQTQNYLDVAKVLIMVLDNDKNITMINQTGADILGYSKEEIVGKNWIENFSPKNIHEDLNKIADEIIQDKNNYSGHENLILAKNGEERLMSWKNTAITDSKGNTIGILTSGEDVTEKRKREKQLLLHTKQAQMGEMIGMIAHQWRQPLASIAATISSLKFKQGLGTYEEKYFSEQLDNIEEYTQHLSKTIDDFRNFYKEDKKHINSHLTDIINRAIDIVKAIFTNKGIELRTHFRSKGEFSTYPNELTQVILNILKNAQDALEENKIKNPIIEIETYERDGKFYIEIKDNAGGIPKDIIDRVFDPYFTTKDDLNGSGLGLYMSKTIIEEHCEGHIEVKNVDNGALFIITLQ